MPTYSYRCTECDNAFDIHQAFTDDSLTVCDVCGGKLRKLFNTIGVTFNGSGFYRTDSRNEGGGAKSESGGGSSKSESGSGSSSKSDSGSGGSAGSGTGGSGGSGSTSASSSASKGASSTTV